MKKFLHIALLIGAVSALMCSCGPKEPATDGLAEFTSFTITAEANPVLELDRDYKAVINNVEGTASESQTWKYIIRSNDINTKQEAQSYSCLSF